MLNKEKVSLGIAPIGWTNDDMPDLGKNMMAANMLDWLTILAFSQDSQGQKWEATIRQTRKY